MAPHGGLLGAGRQADDVGGGHLVGARREAGGIGDDRR